jgi:hypothetical protein
MWNLVTWQKKFILIFEAAAEMIICLVNRFGGLAE